jgi:hypothetical protein
MMLSSSGVDQVRVYRPDTTAKLIGEATAPDFGGAAEG